MNLNIAYIGGGSRAWARKLMNDLALEGDICGEVRLYDKDYQAALNNQTIGNRISSLSDAKAKWDYKAVKTLSEALYGADFVIISILPATFKEMQCDVHYPEKYGVYQSVGDTVGFGGYLRGMRTAPIYREFAWQIKTYCPDAWVINYTNPMTICTAMLYAEFPEIKAFGCCHEVFSTQELLCKVLMDIKGIADVTRNEIIVDVSGVNHFTWFSSAKYEGIDLFPLFYEFANKYYNSGYNTTAGRECERDYMQCANMIKFQMFKRYGVIPAAGDRHLAEFFPNKWFLESPERVKKNKFALTPVSWRISDMEEKIKESKEYVSSEKALTISLSGEEGVKQIKALLGIENLTTNVNLPNKGQLSNYPFGAIVETNASFTKNKITPVKAKCLPLEVESMILKHSYRQQAFIKAVFNKDINAAKYILQDDPQAGGLTLEQTSELFDAMYENGKEYLDYYWKS